MSAAQKSVAGEEAEEGQEGAQAGIWAEDSEDSMSDRTYGDTKNCAGCRFWSEMIAQSIGGGPVQAMCLAESGRYAGKYTVHYTRCDSWKSGHHGAVDDPPNYGEETRALYAEEDASAETH